MATYRAYILDPAGKIAWGDWLEAVDQAEAEAKARALSDKGGVELWQGARRLAGFPWKGNLGDATANCPDRR
jgi:hypothetical protein